MQTFFDNVPCITAKNVDGFWIGYFKICGKNFIITLGMLWKNNDGIIIRN